MTGVKDAAVRWIEDDPDPETRAEGHAILAADDPTLLAEYFGQRLHFGTAGLRARLGPGPNRMNRAVVRRVTSAVGTYMEGSLSRAHELGVVVAFDGRHGSRPFALETACVLAARGFRVYLYDDVTPTPQAAHAVRFLGCAGGIVVTASHNPPEDNGYKVFWANGAQIVPPQDVGISDAIDAIERIADIAVLDIEQARETGLIQPVPSRVLESYLKEVAALRVYDGPTDLKVVYTAMHGVGRTLIETVLHNHGYTGLVSVEEQGDPNPDFPTVSFPNPEEPGAMDLSLEYGRSIDADLIIANDPDADRLAVAVPDGAGGYRQLTGNQVGVLLAHELLVHGPQVPGRLVATTIVSSSMLKVISEHFGVDYAETLTGFKWLAQHSITAESAGGRFVMGFEEALGYSVGHVVRDKDGVSAALLFCDLASRCQQEGKSVLDRLAEIYRLYGVYASKQHALKLPGEEGRIRIETIMADLRANLPTHVGGRSIAVIRDISTGQATSLNDGSVSKLGLPESNVLAFDFSDGGRILARPSGTEPKIKFYFEVRDEMQQNETLLEGETRAQKRLVALEKDFLALIGI